MSDKSRKSSKKIDRPFAPGILAKARDIAARYQVILQFEDGEYFGRGLELPRTMADGKTADECVANTREAMVGTVAYLLETGKVPPAPASDQTRSAQVNIRLTPAEKELLESAAHQNGFRGVSDYLRHAVLLALV
jgi:predicted RNase H-like HicB family nuclease